MMKWKMKIWMVLTSMNCLSTRPLVLCLSCFNLDINLLVVVIFNMCCTFAGFWSCYDLCDDLILSWLWNLEVFCIYFVFLQACIYTFMQFSIIGRILRSHLRSYELRSYTPHPILGRSYDFDNLAIKRILKKSNWNSFKPRSISINLWVNS